MASRVFAWPSTSRPPRQMPSTVCSLPVASSITSSGGKSSSPMASSASSTDSGSGPGRASSSAWRRSTFAESTRKPREPLAWGGFMQTSRAG